MAESKKLATYVHVDGVEYGPDSEVPAEVAKKITNDDVWAKPAKASDAK